METISFSSHSSIALMACTLMLLQSTALFCLVISDRMNVGLKTFVVIRQHEIQTTKKDYIFETGFLFFGVSFLRQECGMFLWNLSNYNIRFLAIKVIYTDKQ